VIAGHFAVAGAVHASWREVPLLWLLGASIAPDVADGLYVLAGVCNPHGLYSHTVPAAALIAAIVGGAAFLTTGLRSAGLMTAAVTMAHLPLDFVTGLKLFWPGGELLGLHLYTRPGWDFAVESAMVLAAWRLLQRQPGVPRWTVAWPVVAALLVFQAAAAIGSGAGDGLKPSACTRVEHTPA
jgi:hypothetical protein